MKIAVFETTHLTSKAFALSLLGHLLVLCMFVFQFSMLPIPFKPSITFLGGFLDNQVLREFSFATFNRPETQSQFVSGITGDQSIFLPTSQSLQKPSFPQVTMKMSKADMKAVMRYPSKMPANGTSKQKNLGVELTIPSYQPLKLYPLQ